MRISDWSSDVCSSDLHYHAAYVAPRWRSTLERVAQIGAHIFYRNQESARLTGKYSGEEPVLPAILTLERRVGAQGSIQEKREARSEEHTSELQSLMRTSYAVFCLKQQQPHYFHHPKHLPYITTETETINTLKSYRQRH